MPSTNQIVGYFKVECLMDELKYELSFHCMWISILRSNQLIHTYQVSMVRHAHIGLKYFKMMNLQYFKIKVSCEGEIKCFHLVAFIPYVGGDTLFRNVKTVFNCLKLHFLNDLLFQAIAKFINICKSYFTRILHSNMIMYMHVILSKCVLLKTNLRI